jgi:ubiquitin carboxyl-terminal hydrolase 5/13
LPVHLASLGINVQTLSKTEKSMTELVCVRLFIESQWFDTKLPTKQNLKYDFSLTGDDGKALEPVFGSGLKGLANLGNRKVDRS